MATGDVRGDVRLGISRIRRSRCYKYWKIKNVLFLWNIFRETQLIEMGHPHPEERTHLLISGFFL